jgi:hypothetical protein
MKLTVSFDPPYWVGVLEEERDGVLYAARYIFGAMPGNQEIYDLVRHDLNNLRAAIRREFEQHKRDRREQTRAEREAAQGHKR